ncbi:MULTISPECIES: translesion DNA synthesis-associated protein ImuA [unclassified Caballeronia]|uniref:translesion DNA synthesis-associated protein ImuA n=1 Tax=unclassified Caballeronia TaxID=2646786 RepID=UPI002859CBFC|nr:MULTISPECIES: translesion DNA synthesis-associated protein ImuA [unclassified Caballeronia]MDR5776976.1 translesion DNA synthesis-associated protein ImuA [Caballeronia sp. LZ002]MDR5852449.1 translesion DNA synthesis-associated protein ImuA [Caballeronia sp. LZ003]
MSTLPKNVEDIHPSLWRGNQLARSVGRTVPTGYDRLDCEMPGSGWPVSALTEIMCARPGIGEMRLLLPALKLVSKRDLMFVDPPAVPNALGYAYAGLPPEKVTRLEPANTADALWSAEQILKANTCGALVLWQNHMRPESLRRLSLHAQSSETLFFVMRPLTAQNDTSSASVRIAVRPAEGGVSIEMVKRKGPVGIEPFVIELTPSPILISPHRRAVPRAIPSISETLQKLYSTTE